VRKIAKKEGLTRRNAPENAKRGRPRGPSRPRYKIGDELPEFLRPRDIYHLLGVSPAQLRQVRRDGTLPWIRFKQNGAPRYPTRAVMEYFAADSQIAKSYASLFNDEQKVPAQSPMIFPPLLRLRDVIKLIGYSRDEIEVLCSIGRKLTPFYKKKGSKALYRTWQFNRRFGSDFLRIQPEPHNRKLRRREVAQWLSVPFAEIESWVRLGFIKRHSRGRKRAWGYFDRNEVTREVVLGLNASKLRNYGLFGKLK
jgi:hypothetical protein